MLLRIIKPPGYLKAVFLFLSSKEVIGFKYRAPPVFPETTPCLPAGRSETKKLGSRDIVEGFFAESVAVRSAAGAERHPVLKGIWAGR